MFTERADGGEQEVLAVGTCNVQLSDLLLRRNEENEAEVPKVGQQEFPYFKLITSFMY